MNWGRITNVRGDPWCGRPMRYVRQKCVGKHATHLGTPYTAGCQPRLTANAMPPGDDDTPGPYVISTRRATFPYDATFSHWTHSPCECSQLAMLGMIDECNHTAMTADDYNYYYNCCDCDHVGHQFVDSWTNHKQRLSTLAIYHNIGHVLGEMTKDIHAPQLPSF